MGDNVVSTVDHLAGDSIPFGRSTGSTDNVVGDSNVFLAMANYLDLTSQESVPTPPSGTTRVWFDGTKIRITSSNGDSFSLFNVLAGELQYPNGDTLATSTTLLYPSTGAVLAASGTLSDPLGNQVTDGSALYYPGGDNVLANTSSLNNPHGDLLADAEQIYYPGGTSLALANASTLYYPSPGNPLCIDTLLLDPLGNGVTDGVYFYYPGESALIMASENSLMTPGETLLADADNNLYTNLISTPTTGFLQGNGPTTPISTT